MVGAAPPPGYTTVPRDFTLLRVIEPVQNGVYLCKVLTRYKDGVPLSAGVAGYRCMKLPTVNAPLAVRLVGGDGRDHKNTSTVSVRATAPVSDRLTHSSSACAPSPPGPNITVGIPADAMKAASAQ